jgi:hypothetical protein
MTHGATASNGALKGLTGDRVSHDLTFLLFLDYQGWSRDATYNGNVLVTVCVRSIVLVSLMSDLRTVHL